MLLQAVICAVEVSIIAYYLISESDLKDESV